MDLTLLLETLTAATERRAELLTALTAEGTDCVRLLHGAVEGLPGTAVDRYGPVLLVQTWRETLPEGALPALEQWAQETLGLDLVAVHNHRADRREPAPHRELPDPPLGHELGLTYDVSPRHRGDDPLLFLDMRAGRRQVKAAAEGRSVLNFFAYTCGLGQAAAAGGATEVLNVDFARSALEVGEQNAARNQLTEGFSTLQEDFFPVARQLSGLGMRDRRGGRQPRYQRMAARSYDLVLLDPPRWAKSRFGAVDVVRDYASLFKPALLCASEGGAVLATNHVAHVDEDEWVAGLRRSAEKAGRPLRDLTLVRPEADFPSPDQRWPLKMAWCEV